MSDKQSPSRARTATATSRLEGSLQLLNAAAAESAVSLVEFLGALQSGTDEASSLAAEYVATHAQAVDALHVATAATTADNKKLRAAMQQLLQRLSKIEDLQKRVAALDSDVKKLEQIAEQI